MLYRALLVTKSAYLVQEYPLLMRSYRMTKVRLWNTSFYIPTLGAQMIYLADFKPQLFSFFRGKLEIIKDCECGLFSLFFCFLCVSTSAPELHSATVWITHRELFSFFSKHKIKCRKNGKCILCTAFAFVKLPMH